MIWLWWAPLGAAALHIGEEFVYPGGFASWDREYRPSISSSITPRIHFIVNALLLVACVTVGISGMPDGAIVVGGFRFRSALPASLSVIGWLALAGLLFSNALFHLVGTYRTKRVSPGVRTGVLLYIPLAVAGCWYFIHAGQVSAVAGSVSALLGGSYHFWASLAHRWRARGQEA
ncbi:MAG TPA: HXXEE domain-containing protein [Candidatus Polarisedimenticolia bacterium]